MAKLHDEMNSLLLELEKAAWMVLDVKTEKEKDVLCHNIHCIKSKIREVWEKQIVIK
jgi:hypothetical protein